MQTDPAPPTTAPFPPAAVEALRRTVRGTIAYPADPTYLGLIGAGESAVRPAVVVAATCEADVVAVVDVVRDHGLALHGADPAGSVVVITDRLDDVRVDPASLTATAGAGATADRLREAAAEHDLAPGPVLARRVVGPDGFVRALAPDEELPSGAVVTAVVVALDS